MSDRERDLNEMEIELRAADALAKAVDDAVQSGWLNARSTIADARLNYGQPFEYKWTKRKG